MSVLRQLPPWVWTPLVFVVDFVSKRIVLAHEEALRGRIEIIGDFARFIYVRNSGSAMGLFPVGRTTLIIVSVIASVFIAYLYRTTAPHLRLRLAAMAAILGGALGNLVDRIFYGGHVVDFIDLGIGADRFYTFNVADMGVSIGGAILFLCILLEGRGRSGRSLTATGDGDPGQT